ncbi:TGS domain-containing protein [Candidatus Pacearchaeota archaeon]|nr:TGS domain-containing protein [Candidatus Pacearchaeota archaeon]
MPVNAGYEYFNAEGEYAKARTIDEKIAGTELMIKMAPKHKSSENLLALLRNRLKKFKEGREKARKTGKSTREVIKKEGFQIVLIGPPNTGKSSLLAHLTNARPKISIHPFTTIKAEVGTLDYHGVKAQVIDLPSIGSPGCDIGILNTADLVLIVLAESKEYETIKPLLMRIQGEHKIIITKQDLLSEEANRKLQATIKSKKIPALLISTHTGEGIEELKGYIFKTMHVCRIYLKEPGKPVTHIPLVIPENTTVRGAGEKIYKGFSAKIRETRISGPSSKFANQKVGLLHILKDKDIVEFHTN